MKKAELKSFLKTKKGKGIRYNLLNALLCIVMAVTFVVILLITHSISQDSKRVQVSINNYTLAQNATQKFADAARYFTEQARLYVVTHDRKYLENYFRELNETQRAEKALKEIEDCFGNYDGQYVNIMIAYNQMQTESELELLAFRYAFEGLGEEAGMMPTQVSNISIPANMTGLSKDEYLDLAMDTLFNNGYMRTQMRLDENINSSLSSLERTTELALTNNYKELFDRLFHQKMLLSFLFIVLIVIFAVEVVLVSIPLKDYLRSIKKDSRLIPAGSFELRYLAETYNEIYDLKEKTKRNLEITAEYDALTGIYNRRAFDRICESYQGAKEGIALLIVDFDNFKNVNDTFGHKEGDRALKFLADTLTANFRKSDYVARIGGDEFAVIMTEFNDMIFEIIRRKIRKINFEDLPSAEGLGRLSVSVGAAVSESGYSPTLYEHADQALYQVKGGGKKDVHIYGH